MHHHSSNPVFPAMLPPDARAREVLRGEDCPWEPTGLQRQLLQELLWHVGAASPIPLRDLLRKTSADERGIKDAFRSLVVDFRVRIGASRSQPNGYYLVATAAEAAAAAQPYIAEIMRLSQRVRVLLNAHDVADLLGQFSLQLREITGGDLPIGSSCEAALTFPFAERKDGTDGAV